MMVSQGFRCWLTETSWAVPSAEQQCYAQDNELLVDWDLDADQKDLLPSVCGDCLRKAHPILRRHRFFAGDAKHGGGSELGDILWFKPDASEMDEVIGIPDSPAA